MRIPAATFNTFVDAAEDAAPRAIVKVSVAAYAERVYEEGDFAGLGIRT